MPVEGLTPAQVAAETFKQVQNSVKSTSPAAKLKGESQAEANARLTAAYKEFQAKPILSQEATDKGARVQYTRQAAGGIGEYVTTVPAGYTGPKITKEFGPGIIRPDLVRTNVNQAGVTPGTVVPTGVTTTNAAGAFGTAKTPDQIAAYNSAKDLAQSFVSAYGGKLSDYFDAATGKVTSPSKETITNTLNTKNNPKAKTVVKQKNNSNGSVTTTWSDGTTTTDDTDSVNNSTDKTLVSTDIDNATGDTIGYFSDGSKLVLNKGTGPVQSAEFKDAYALLNQTFRDYGLESLVPAIEGFMKRNLGPNQAAIELRTMPEYIARFKGNDLRRASGKNALTEAEYLAVEDAYDQTLRAYGQQNYFGIDRKTKQEKAAELIGNDISAVEFKDRIQLAVDRVQNADPMTKDVLKQFYPTLNESDLIGYFLNPKDNLPKLQEKVTASEIGAAAKGLNLATDVATATDLAKYGVTQAQAREGYSGISAVLPTATKLGDIYGETGVKYAQKEAEAEVFKGNQDAATKRKRLASMERAAFSGSSGVGQSSLSKSTQGLI
jgi:hypothetical protein